jgi:RNA polymerase sigma-70 factor, ECF subfamily
MPEAVNHRPLFMSNCPVGKLPANTVKAARPPEDFELIRRCQTGDTEAFGALVLKYQTRLFTMICCMVGDENDAWDLAQEGFVKAWRSIQHFESRSSFYTWLHRISLNLALDFLRRRGRRSEVELDDTLPSPLPSPRANYERAETREEINAALAQLSPEHRAVIVLREIEDMTYLEIADVLDLSQGTVMSRLFYARQRLKSLLLHLLNNKKKTTIGRSDPNLSSRTDQGDLAYLGEAQTSSTRPMICPDLIPL